MALKRVAIVNSVRIRPSKMVPFAENGATGQRCVFEGHLLADVELYIDAERILDSMKLRTVRSRRRKATALNGAIVTKAVNVRVVPDPDSQGA